MPTIYSLLEADHREVTALLDQLVGSGDSFDEPARRLLVDRLIAAESRHEAAEEMVFWPAVRRRLSRGRALSDEGHRQEGEGKALLDTLRWERANQHVDSMIGEAAALMRRHIAFEEQEVWPALRRATGPVGSRLLGRQFLAAKRVAPTRPHPNGPDGALGLSTVGAAASAGDRLMDRLTGRSRRLGGPLASEGGEGGEGAQAAGRTADPVEFLTAEHARIEQLLRRVEEAEWPDAALVADLVRQLSIHDAIEREHLYPLARRRLQNGNARYPHWMAEHGDIARVLVEIDRRPEHDRFRRDELKRLVPLVRTHIAEEEGSVLPALRAHLSRQELAGLADRLQTARAKAPTRPHPHAAGAGMGARISRLVARPLDRTRDAVSGRR